MKYGRLNDDDNDNNNSNNNSNNIIITIITTPIHLEILMSKYDVTS